MRIRFIFSQVFQGLSRNMAMTVSVILVSFVSLLFVGSSSLLQMQISAMKGAWYDKVEVSIFMCPSSSSQARCPNGEATQAQIASVDSFLRSDSLKPYVKSFQMETKAQAFKNFKAAYGNSPIGRNATEDMMPVSFRVKLVNAKQYQVVAEQFQGRAGVERVVDQRATLEPLFKVMDRASWFAAGLAIVMAVAAFLLIITTIKLSAMSRSKETSIMRLVGASHTFIQLPFMLEGMIAALTGAILAVGVLLLGVHYLINDWLAKSLSITMAFIGTREVLTVAPFLMLGAIVLAGISSMVSLSRYTKV